VKPRGHDTNDRHGLAVEPQHATNDVGVTGIASLPETVVQHHDIVPARPVFFGRKPATERGLDTEQRKQVGGNLETAHPFGGLARFGQVERLVVQRRHVFKAAALLIIDEVRHRVMRLAPGLGRGLEHLYQTPGIRIGQ
jgi:hypothetical protein